MILTHRRRNETHPNTVVGAVLFADVEYDEYRNAGYGDHCWTLVTELPVISDDLVRFAAVYYEISLDEARDVVDPENIVSHAGAWDDQNFISDLWQAMEYGEVEMVPGYRTHDGAAIIDINNVEMKYEYNPIE